MSRGKKIQRGKGAVREWAAFLCGEGVAPGQVTEAVQAARDLVTGDGQQVPDLVGDVAEALAAVLGEQDRLDLLVRCGEEGSRDLAKACRRALHSLRQRGAQVPRLTQKAAPIEDAPADDVHQDARAVMSAPFSDGDRGLVFRFRGPTDRQLHAGLAMVSDINGLRDLQLFRGGAKTYRTMLEEARSTLSVAPVPFGYALGLLEQGARDVEARGRLLPQTYRTLRQRLGEDWPRAEPHPGEHLTPDELPDAEALFELWKIPELRTWLAPTDLMDELARDMQEVLSSSIIINEQQRLERLSEVLTKTVARVFDDEARPRWAARLLDAAWVASQNRRSTEAGQLLAVRAMLEATDAPEGLPFCRQLVARPLIGQLPEPLAAGLIPGMPAKPLAESADPPAPESLVWTPDDDPEPAPDSSGSLIVPGH